MMKSDEIAKAFLHEMNPTNWNGQGGMPAGFDARTLEFITDMPDVLLDISFEFCMEDNSTFQWEHCCELVQESSDTIIERVYGYGIDSVQNLTDTINYLLEGNLK
jgi:hypothetical protein|nr:MAG TPA: hypothetical protein [Caudoviricetes sp.]